MSILTVFPSTLAQETTIRLFHDAMHINYNTAGEHTDETTYLSSSPAMAAHLNKAANQEKKVKASPSL